MTSKVTSRTIPFAGEPLDIFTATESGQQCASITRVSEILGADPEVQLRKLEQEEWAKLVLHPDRKKDGEVMLDIKCAPQWLGELMELSEVSDEIRPRLAEYQKDYRGGTFIFSYGFPKL